MIRSLFQAFSRKIRCFGPEHGLNKVRWILYGKLVLYIQITDYTGFSSGKAARGKGKGLKRLRAAFQARNAHCDEGASVDRLGACRVAPRAVAQGSRRLSKLHVAAVRACGAWRRTWLPGAKRQPGPRSGIRLEPGRQVSDS